MPEDLFPSTPARDHPPRPHTGADPNPTGTASPHFDPERGCFVDRYGRDPDDCRRHAALALDYADRLRVVIAAVCGGELEFGREVGLHRMVQRLEVSMAAFERLAARDHAFASVLDELQEHETAYWAEAEQLEARERTKETHER
jgi:hypothetical protein